MRKHSLPGQILRALLIAGIITIALSSPYAGQGIVRDLMCAYERKKRFERWRLLQDLKRLQRRKLIHYHERDDGTVEMAITRRGRDVALTWRLEDLALKRDVVWDGTWRLVMFDIPHTQRSARDAFRRKLRDLKFYQLQKSVFITPYPCEDEIDFLGTLFEVRACVLVLTVPSFGEDRPLRVHFGV
ncbi:MAG: hypothetical protein HY536_00070 [Candidatus Colwellbacteria bacterium]|nr:hypothetical protein [Candidatus Colwellbacteria bacterium]